MEKESNNNNGFILVSIVAIVAVVAIIVLITGNKQATQPAQLQTAGTIIEEKNLAGESYYSYKYDDKPWRYINCPYGASYYNCSFGYNKNCKVVCDDGYSFWQRTSKCTSIDYWENLGNIKCASHSYIN